MSQDFTPSHSLLNRLIGFCLHNKLVVTLAAIFFVFWGILVAPFDWNIPWLRRSPVAVDAIPDIGENQQIVFTEWPGRSPQDVEDQVSYPLTTALLGIPGVKTIRSFSMFGFSSVYIIFKENVDFYWSRSRVLEKLNSLPAGTLPPGVQPMLGPDATAMGQIFWYTLEGRDPQGRPAGGWDLNELRTIQDFYVRYALQTADGVSEVASVGGFEQEYQVDVDPDAMRAFNVTLEDVFMAVKRSNIDVGARTIEVNKVEYVIRGLGFIGSVEDLENTVITSRNNIPIYVKNVAHVTLGPALRRGALDKAGAEAVGGVVTARYGSNPLLVIKNVKAKIDEISPGLPSKPLPDGTVSKVTIVPFYDRTGLIYETLGTLNHAIRDEILITMIVVIFMVLHLRSSILISALLPLTVLTAFILMKLFHVDANIVALSGIAIAIGTIVDMGIVICENILKRLEEAGPDEKPIDVIYRAACEVGSAVLTAVSTTIVGFLPVFAMEGPEGKLFKPLAFTKTFALLASIVIALTIIPPYAHILFAGRLRAKLLRRLYFTALAAAGVVVMATLHWIGVVLAVFGVWKLIQEHLPRRMVHAVVVSFNFIVVLLVARLLAETWLPLGAGHTLTANFLFVAAVVGGLLGGFFLFQLFYEPLLRWCLKYKLVFLSLPAALVMVGLWIWLGFDRVMSWTPEFVRSSAFGQAMSRQFPGLGREFMPNLDEGSFLYMPVAMPHVSIGGSMELLEKLDMAIQSIPEVELAVGKLGRAESPLDPAPVSMFEIVINYKPEYLTDSAGNRLRFRFDESNGTFVRDERGELIPDPHGRPFRLWRDHIKSPDDIWKEIVEAARIPGITSAPKLQPIAARVVMLQSGMRAPMGVKVQGPDLKTIEAVGFRIEQLLKQTPGVQPEAVVADRIVGVPYLEIAIARDKIARYGLRIQDVQDVIEVALGGIPITKTVEGRERYTVRVRYLRELRDSIETLGRVLVSSPGMGGAPRQQIPLSEVADIQYVRGPQMIKSEDTFLTGYVLFDKLPGYAEVDVVENARAYLRQHLDPELPAGVSYRFAGTYENQIRAAQRLAIVLPLALFVIFLILYFQFRSVLTTFFVFSGIFVAWSGGFLMIWLYGQPWFLNFDVFGVSMRELFQIHPINLSVAVWVGFLALFGIATDDGVVIATYIEQSFHRHRPTTREEIREAIVAAGKRRIRPCLMTTATTVLALLPVLTSTGRGSDVMVPMAIPSFGGMCLQLITLFVVPTLYCFFEEAKLVVAPSLVRGGGLAPAPQQAPGR
ncbi:MAG: efflux RND transporter permease subunit [Candidatus Sumerlaeia bacterium]